MFVGFSVRSMFALIPKEYCLSGSEGWCGVGRERGGGGGGGLKGDLEGVHVGACSERRRGGEGLSPCQWLSL